jgi:hypothetical protein
VVKTERLSAEDYADLVRVNGYAVIDGLLPQPLIEEMRAAFDKLLAEHIAANPSNRGANRYQMYLPFEAPFADPRVYANPAVMAVVEAVLGPNAACVYFASDTPLPGSDYQRVHSDTQLLFPEANLSLPCYGLVLNIPLVDVTDENGPLEVWPGGTHLWSGKGEIASLAERMPHGPLRMNAGDVVIRDLRMWHRGTPNRSDRSRPNVALVYVRPWYRFEQKPPVIRLSSWNALSPAEQRLFRHATVVDLPPPVVEGDEMGPETLPAKPPEPPTPHEVVQGLVESLHRATDYETYHRIAMALARNGTDEAIWELANQARTQEEFLLVAINALAASEHAVVIPTLLDLLVNGAPFRRRLSAYALARLKAPQAILPLAAAAADRNDPVQSDAVQALREMGRPEELARSLLKTAGLTAREQITALSGLAAAGRFNAQRFLDREAADQNGPIRGVAGALSGLYRERETLLRASDELPDEALVRPAQNPSAVAPGQLLRTAQPLPEGGPQPA